MSQIWYVQLIKLSFVLLPRKVEYLKNREVYENSKSVVPDRWSMSLTISSFLTGVLVVFRHKNRFLFYLYPIPHPIYNSSNDDSILFPTHFFYT